MGVFGWTWSGTWRAISRGIGSPTTNYYVTWEYFESFVVTSGLSPMGANYKTERPHIGKDKLQSDPTFESKLWYLDSTDSMLTNREHKYNCSTNPFVAYIPGYFHFAGGKSGFKRSAKRSGIVKAESCTTIPAWSGALQEILINTDFIWEQYVNATTISDFVMKVATGINTACGDQWNLRLIESPDDPNRMMVIDMRNSEDPAKLSIPTIDVKGAARSWGLSTEIPDDLRHSIMMASNKDKDKVLSNKDDKVINIYGTQVKDTLLVDIAQTPKCPELPIDDCEDPVEVVEKKISEYEAELIEAINELADNVTQDAIDSAKIAQHQYFAQLALKKTEPNLKPVVYVIPLGWNATLDGMGGLTWGKSFNVKQVNEAGVLPSGHYFRFTDIGHSISQTDWTTTVDTALMIPPDESSLPPAEVSTPAAKPAKTKSSTTTPVVYQEIEETPSGEDEEIDPTCLESAYKAKSYAWDPKFNFFGIRRLPASGVRTNKWIDILGVWLLDENGNEKTYTWPATTVPGVHKNIKDEVATVIPGQYKNTYEFTWNRPGKNSGAADKRSKSPAMGGYGGSGIAATRLDSSTNSYEDSRQVSRYSNPSFQIHGVYKQDASVMPINWLPPPSTQQRRAAWGDTVNNLNTGGNKTLANVGENSQGCQVFKMVPDLYDFMELAKFHLNNTGTTFMTYTLLTEEEVPDCSNLQDGLPNYTGTGDR